MNSGDFQSIHLSSSQLQGSSELLEKEVDSLETFYQPDKLYHQGQQCQPQEFEKLPGKTRFEEMNPRKSLFLPMHPKQSNFNQILGQQSMVGQSIPTTSFPVIELGNAISQYPSTLLDDDFIDKQMNSCGFQKKQNDEDNLFLQQPFMQTFDIINRNNTIYVPLDSTQGYLPGIPEFERCGSTPQFSQSITGPQFSQYEGNCQQQCFDYQNEFSNSPLNTLQQINNDKKNIINPVDFQHISKLNGSNDDVDELHQVLEKNLLNKQMEGERQKEVKQSVLKSEQNWFFTEKKVVQQNSSQNNNNICQVGLFQYDTPSKNGLLSPTLINEDYKTNIPTPLQNLQESGLSTFQTARKQLQQQRNPQESDSNIIWLESYKNKDSSPGQIEQLFDNNLTFQVKQQSQKQIQKQTLNIKDLDENNRNSKFQDGNDGFYSNDKKNQSMNIPNQQGITRQQVEDIISNVFKEAKEKLLIANLAKQGSMGSNNNNNLQQNQLGNNQSKSDGLVEFDQRYFLTIENEILNRVKSLEKQSNYLFVSPQQQQQAHASIEISNQTKDQPEFVSEFQIPRKSPPELIKKEESLESQIDSQQNQFEQCNIQFQIEKDQLTSLQQSDENDRIQQMSNYTDYLLEQQKQNDRNDYFRPINYPPCGMVNNSNINTNEANQGSMSTLGQFNSNTNDRIKSNGMKCNNRNKCISVHEDSSEFSFLKNHSSHSFVLSKSQEQSKDANNCEEKAENLLQSGTVLCQNEMNQLQPQENKQDTFGSYHSNTTTNEIPDQIFFKTSLKQSNQSNYQCNLSRKESPRLGCYQKSNDTESSQNEKDMKYRQFLVSLLEKMKTPKKEILEKLSKLDSMKESINDKKIQIVSHFSQIPCCNHINDKGGFREKQLVFQSNSPSCSNEGRIHITNKRHNQNLAEKNIPKNVEQISQNIFTFNANKLQGNVLRPTNCQLKMRNQNQRSVDRKRSSSLISSPNQKSLNIQSQRSSPFKVGENMNNPQHKLAMDVQYQNNCFIQNQNQKSITPNSRSKYHQLNSALKGKFFDTYEPMICSAKRGNSQLEQQNSSRNALGQYQQKAQTAQERKYSPNRLISNPKQTNPFNIPQNFQIPQYNSEVQQEYPFISQIYSLNSEQKKVHFSLQQQLNKIGVSKSNNCSPTHQCNREPFQTLNYPRKQDQLTHNYNKNDQDSHSLVLNLKDMQEYAALMRQKNIQLLKSLEKTPNIVQTSTLEDKTKGIANIFHKEQQQQKYVSHKSQEKWHKEPSSIRLKNQLNNNLQNR